MSLSSVANFFYPSFSYNINPYPASVENIVSSYQFLKMADGIYFGV
jgi:hypothetical protein